MCGGDGKERGMIKAEKKIKGKDSAIMVKFEGESEEIIAELCEVLTKGADVITDMLEEEGKK